MLPSPKLPVIAVVDDNDSIRHAMDSLLRACGYEVHTFSSAQDFLDSFYFDATECLIADLHMPSMGGVELLACVRDKCPRIAIVLMSAGYETELIEGARLSGACQVLSKPFDDARLLESITMAIATAASGRTCPAMCRHGA